MFLRQSRAKAQPETCVETVEEFLARGGRIERIDDYPLPDGRVLLRGQRERQAQQLAPAPVLPFGGPSRPTSTHRHPVQRGEERDDRQDHDKPINAGHVAL
jgi:hypothetical protein